ncbi:MAG: DMT family transporter [Rhodobacteraceae bacterium]|nr:DMT family transporter [Paracoccaceae bacterium]
MTIFNFLLALGMGAAISIYLPMISQSARILGAPVLGNVPFFAIAFLSSVVLVFVTGHKLPTMAKLAEVPAWLFIAGVVSALMIFGSSYLVPRIGTGALFVLLVAGQIIIGAVINHYGLLGVPEQSISTVKFSGTVLVLAGAVLVSFGDQLFAK